MAEKHIPLWKIVNAKRCSANGSTTMTVNVCCLAKRQRVNYTALDMHNGNRDKSNFLRNQNDSPRTKRKIRYTDNADGLNKH